jgi:peroxiredoxin/tetratricopeptide (TPR) repeat protein
MRPVFLALALTLPWPLAAGAADPAPGHSYHGEAFNEGPRQAAVLIDGCGDVVFPITTKKDDARKFFLQGVGQLHGFWYFEAERSFRQAAAIDPACAMAYWGCAMANVNNDKRAAEFIKKAAAKKAGTTPLESAWITVLEDFYKDPKKDKKQRKMDFIKGIENIIHDHPKDLEAKAFLAWAIWHAKEAGVPMVSRESVDAILSQVFAKAPMHPAHHYRIHLWDDHKPARAVEAATLCGQSAPAIAHMWHMPGHTFSKVNRLADATWQQDAATRVDHAYMIRTQILPDQIHNYAHNTEWLVRSYSQMGRAREAAALARNLVEIPRHPDYNTLEKKGRSAIHGRNRLLETLLTWELWDEVLALDGSPYLDTTRNPSFEAARLRALGVAAYFKGDRPRLQRYLADVSKLTPTPAPSPPATHTTDTKPVAKTTAASSPSTTSAQNAKATEPSKPAAGDTQKPDRKKSGGKPDFAITNAKAELTALTAILDKTDASEIKKQLAEIKDAPKERLVHYHLAVQDKEKAATLAQQLPMDAPGLALRVDALVRAGKPEEAKKHFETLRKTAGSLDLDVPISARIDAIAAQFGAPRPWRRPEAPRTDSGVRPALETLGPLHWHPFPARPFVLPDEANYPVALRDFAGRPVVVLFYLGNTCTHCMEQLKVFADAAADFRKQGIELVAIGSEEPADLFTTAEACHTPDDAPSLVRLLADPQQEVFRQWRCYDDFEGMPLHGAFLVDAQGLVRWMSIGHEPFRDVKFLQEEASRLLKFTPPIAPGLAREQSPAPLLVD